MKTIQKHWPKLFSLITCAVASVGIFTAVADPPQPVLSIQHLGSNQFSILVTNAIETNYTLFWKPILGDAGYPWQVLEVGGSNFVVDGGEIPFAFFKILLGSDSDGDGILEPFDANSDDPSIGILSLTIRYPTNGAVLQ